MKTYLQGTNLSEPSYDKSHRAPWPWLRQCLALLTLLLLAASSRALAETRSPQLFLWELKKDQAIVYLLGSIHLLRPEDLPFPALLDEVFAQADQVMFEADIDEAKSLPKQLTLVTKATYVDGSTLRQHVGTALHDRLLAYGQANNAQILDVYRPWFVTDLITLTEVIKAGFNEELGPDPFYFAKAKVTGKRLLFLETVDFQFSLLAGGSDADQIRALTKTLDDLPSISQDTERLARNWKEGDVAAVRAATAQEATDDPAGFERLVTSRNRDWVPKIEKLLNQPKTTLVIAGAAHMVGEQGVVNLLRNKGYVLEQLPRVPGALRPVRIARVQIENQRSLRLQIEVETERSYTVESSADLGEWRATRTFFATNAVSTWLLDMAVADGSQFFRVIAPPRP